MPGLDLRQVSSNWKKLQETLQAGKKDDSKKDDLKRKRPLAHGKPVKAFKKARVEDSGHERLKAKANMGQNGANESSAHERLAREYEIPKEDIAAAYGDANGSTSMHKDEVNGGLHATHKAGKYVALDCEMVGTGPPPHHDHVLARVSLVNFHGEQIYDSYVLPQPGVKVEDYRTHVSGIKPDHLRQGYARPFAEVQKTVANLLDGRILIGHALRNDLKVLVLSHSQRDIRDTFRYTKFREENDGRPPSLRNLAEKELGMKIQLGEHSSIEDARAAMMIFRKEKAGFEEEVRKRYGVHATSARRVAKQRMVSPESGASGEENDAEEDDEADLELLDGEESGGLADDGLGSQPKPTQRPKKKPKKKKRTKRK